MAKSSLYSLVYESSRIETVQNNQKVQKMGTVHINKISL